MKVDNKNYNVFCDLTVKEMSPTETGSIIVKGYANTATKDRAGDVIPASAWSEKALQNYRKNPIILAYHDHSRPIGKCIELTATGFGLEVVVEILDADQEVFKLVQAGILKCFSVGFKILDCDYDWDHDIFLIQELELLEISVVSVPCNQDSIFSIAKGLDSNSYKDLKLQFAHQSKDVAGVNQENNDIIKLAQLLGCIKKD